MLDKLQDIVVGGILKFPKLFDLWLKFNNPFKAAIIKENIRLDGNPKKLLEIGCGTGNLAMIFPKECYIGVDIDSGYIEYARKKFDRNFLVMPGEKLTFKDNSFDYILLSSVLHHMDDELCKAVFKECSRVIKKDGRVVILEPEKPPLTAPVDYVLCKLDRGKFIRSKEGYTDLFIKHFEAEKQETIIPGFWKVTQSRNSLFSLKRRIG
jgi:ubiquinone/menaquinone biosynthesis C-methylase UbiE